MEYFKIKTMVSKEKKKISNTKYLKSKEYLQDRVVELEKRILEKDKEIMLLRYHFN
jgi:hypothetical protein